MAQQKQAEKGLAKTASRKKIGTKKELHADCGGELIWSMVFNPRGRMMKVCNKCGTAIGKTGN